MAKSQGQSPAHGVLNTQRTSRAQVEQKSDDLSKQLQGCLASHHRTLERIQYVRCQDIPRCLELFRMLDSIVQGSVAPNPPGAVDKDTANGAAVSQDLMCRLKIEDFNTAVDRSSDAQGMARQRSQASRSPGLGGNPGTHPNSKIRKQRKHAGISRRLSDGKGMMNAEASVGLPRAPDNKHITHISEDKPTSCRDIDDIELNQRGLLRNRTAMSEEESDGDGIVDTDTESTTTKDPTDIANQISKEPGYNFETIMISELLDHRYAIIEALSQKGLKRVLQRWIARCHPGKQSRFPYNGGTAGEPSPDEENPGYLTAPAWWPDQDGWKSRTDACRHKEPHHLKKHERQFLGPYILWCALQHKHDKQYEFSIEKLRQATQGITRDHDKDFPPDADHMLECIYTAYRKYKEFLTDEIDGTSLVSVYLSVPKNGRTVKRLATQLADNISIKRRKKGALGDGENTALSSTSSTTSTISSFSTTDSGSEKAPAILSNSAPMEMVRSRSPPQTGAVIGPRLVEKMMPGVRSCSTDSLPKANVDQGLQVSNLRNTGNILGSSVPEDDCHIEQSDSQPQLITAQRLPPGNQTGYNGPSYRNDTLATRCGSNTFVAIRPKREPDCDLAVGLVKDSPVEVDHALWSPYLPTQQATSNGLHQGSVACADQQFGPFQSLQAEADGCFASLANNDYLFDAEWYGTKYDGQAPVSNYSIQQPIMGAFSSIPTKSSSSLGHTFYNPSEQNFANQPCVNAGFPEQSYERYSNAAW